MFCSRCGKTLMPDATQCPHCGTPVGESRFEGTPYTSAQAHILPDTPAGQASAAYTRTTYTTMSSQQQAEGAVDSRTTYRPVYEEASAPEEIRRDMRSAIDPGEAGEAELPAIDALPEDMRMLGFLTLVCLAMCGAMPLGDSRVNRRAHNVFGILSGILSQVCVAIVCPCWLSAWSLMAVAWIWTTKDCSRKALDGKGVFLAEAICLLTVAGAVLTHLIIQ